MVSNVCRIDKSKKDLAPILKECEKVASYNELSHKQALQLRLICEEIDGMLPNIIDDFEGDLRIEFENGVARVIASIEFKEFTVAKKEELIRIAKNNQNAAAVGITGKIRSFVEDMLLDDVNIPAHSIYAESMCMATSFGEDLNYPYVWTLENYKSNAEKSKEEAWDELEKSVIASVADDVIVGVKGKKADIIIVKKFS
jgi:hypothetical protein